jgi:glucose/arabinose dehydrogenase
MAGMGRVRCGLRGVLTLLLLGLPALNADAPPGIGTCGNLVHVPDSLRYAPFDTDRYLCLPPNFSISVYARIPDARFMALTPTGDLLISQPGAGKVSLVQQRADGTVAVSDFATDLYVPHDLVFHTVADQTYLYVAEGNGIDRFPYTWGDLTAHDKETLIRDLPSGSSPELRGAYAHELKNIAIDSNHRIYVSIASATNADPADRYATPSRGAIYQYAPDGSNGRLFAIGLRNAEGLRFVPGTDLLWAAVNNRDNLAYPYDDGSGNYGLVFQEYVNNHPPDEFTSVRDGGDYGWPFANPNPDTENGFDYMPFDPDQQNNPLGMFYSVFIFDRIAKGIQAHSAPLGLTFLQGTAFPAAYAQGALIALHGSWNRVPYTGYKLIYFPWNQETQSPGPQQDFITGWLDDNTQQYWGRPVATIVDLDGNLFISDDTSGTVYKLTYASPDGASDFSRLHNQIRFGHRPK